MKKIAIFAVIFVFTCFLIFILIKPFSRYKVWYTINDEINVYDIKSIFEVQKNSDVYRYVWIKRYYSPESFQKILKDYKIKKHATKGYMMLLLRINCNKRNICFKEYVIYDENKNVLKSGNIFYTCSAVVPKTRGERLYNIACQNKILLKLRQLMSK